MIKPFPFLIAPLSMAFFGYLSFTQKGILCYSTFIYAYACIPIIELLMKNDESYALAAEKALAKESTPYDVILYMSVATQIALLALFLFSLQDPRSSRQSKRSVFSQDDVAYIINDAFFY